MNEPLKIYMFYVLIVLVIGAIYLSYQAGYYKGKHGESIFKNK